MAVYFAETYSQGKVGHKKAYYDYDWNYCFRPKSDAAAITIANTAQRAVEKKVVYHKPNNISFYNALKAVNFNIEKVSGKYWAACTQFCAACIASAGITTKQNVDSNALKNNLKNNGSFTTLYWGKSVPKNTLRKGDILISYHKNGKRHGVVVISSANGVNDPVSSKSTNTTVTSTRSTIASSAEQVRRGAVAWAKAIAEDNSFHYGQGKWSHHGGCYFCGTNTRIKGNQGGKELKTYCCNPFVFSAFAHGGGDAHMLSMCKKGQNGQMDWSGIKNKAWAKQRFKHLGNPSKVTLIAGDVLCKYGHMALYAGDGMIAEASGHDDGVEGSKSWNKSIKCAKSNVGRFTDAYRYVGSGGASQELPNGAGGVSYMDDGSSLVLESINTLYSSENYEWVTREEKDNSARVKQQEYITGLLSNVSVDLTDSSSSYILTDAQAASAMPISTKQFKYKPDTFKDKTSYSKLTSYPSLVESPYVELSLNGVTIGGYNNTGDKYPNYITSMSVNKINGRVNQYTINLTFQIRYNEDPNFIDSLLSKVGYTNPLKLIYGDSSCENSMFKEDSAVVLDVKHNESVSSSTINYTISAISSISKLGTYYSNYAEQTAKPSTIISKLLYDYGEISDILLNTFTGMKNKTSVYSENLIPSDDKVVTIGGMQSVSPLTYLGHVVSCMVSEDDTSSSSYFLTYDENKSGNIFKVNKISQNTTSTTDLYTIDVGYPDDNFVLDFKLCDNIYWPLVYDYNGNIPKWQYGIDDNGNVLSYKINPLNSDNKYLSESVINSNWWTSITEFPIVAKLKLKGLVVPAMLMTYIRINTLFYGQKDIASGLYVVTEQLDEISSNGYTTTLTLLRVGE